MEEKHTHKKNYLNILISKMAAEHKHKTPQKSPPPTDSTDDFFLTQMENKILFL